MKHYLFVVLAIAATAIGPAAIAAPYRLAHTFQRENPEAGDLFGTSVVLEGGVAAIKSDSGDRDGDGLSVTHVFEQQPGGGWVEAATLEFNSGDNDGNPFIGRELAIDDGEIVIGYGPLFDEPVSQPLQFARRGPDGWSARFNDPVPWRFNQPALEGVPQLTLLTNRTGRDVDISGSFAIATHGGSFPILDSGALIYERDSNGLWQGVANLALEEERDAVFRHVAIEGRTAVAYVENFDVFSSSAAPSGLYLFERQNDETWQQTRVFAVDREFQSVTQVEVDQDTIVARGLVDTGIYERTGGVWELTFRIPATSGLSSVFTDVAVEGDLLALTVATGDVSDPTRVDLLRRTEPGQWSLFTSIHDPSPEPGRTFGASLDLDQGRLLIGTIESNSLLRLGGRQNTPAGAAYLFVPVPEPTSVSMLLGSAAYLLRRRRS